MIHQFNGAQWVPGEKKKGGSKSFPANAKEGTYFNDVTGKIGDTVASISETLGDLMAKSGGLDQIMTGDDKISFINLIKNLEAAAGNNETVSFCVFQLTTDRTTEISFKDEIIDDHLAQDIMNFMIKLLEANGQMDYLRANVFQPGGYEVYINVNYVQDRPIQKLGFHKDDDMGNLLFASLIFNNQNDIAATEWTPDFNNDQKRLNLLRENWPSQIVNEISNFKDSLKGKFGDRPQISGGLLPPYGFLSWVDELIWHSTPFLGNRTTYDAETVKTVLNNAMYGGKISFEMEDILADIWSDPRTKLAAFLSNKPEYSISSRNIDMMQNIWNEVMNSGLFESVCQDVDLVDWSNLKSGNSTGHISAEGIDVIAQNTGVNKRPRVNSNPVVLDTLKKATETAGRRNFIRSYVKVFKT